MKLKRWRTRFRFGYVLHFELWGWAYGVGVKGADWNGGNWLGGINWKPVGPLAYVRWRK